MNAREILFVDLVDAARIRAPGFADLVIAFLGQPDLEPNEPEVAPEDPSSAPPIPGDAWSLPRLLHAIAPATLAPKTATERKVARREAFEATLAAPNPPPRLRLGDLLLELYEAGDEPAHSALLDVFSRAPFVLGLWKAAKVILKRSEARHDAAMFGVLAARVDRAKGGLGSEVSTGTFVYLRRRAWRYLKRLGRTLPDVYPLFAVEVLKNYPEDFDFRTAWVASQIWGHRQLIGQARSHLPGPPQKLEDRYLDEAWKEARVPLLSLLEGCQHDAVASFAIRSLRRDFPAELAKVDPESLARLGARPLAPIQELVVEILTETPELHMSKLAGLGLRGMVLGLLRSRSAPARKYALEYARGYAPDLSKEELAELLAASDRDVRAFAVSRLSAMEPRALGLRLLASMLGVSEAASFAEKAIREHFKPEDVTEEIYLALMLGGGVQRKLADELFTSRGAKVPAGLLEALIDAPECPYYFRYQLLQRLGGYPGSEIGFAWVKKALFAPETRSAVEGWLRAGVFKSPVLDVEWVKGLVRKPQLRELALVVLAGEDWVSPREIGLPWLLDLLRHPDEAVQTFARDYLLHHFGPVDFAEPGRSGAERLFGLATSPKEPPALRGFAGHYLKAHHPDLAIEKRHGVEPRLGHEDFGLERVRPLFASELTDARELAAAIAKEEVLRWGDRELLYVLADSPHREPRRLAEHVLLAIGDPAHADAARTPPVEWLDASRIFALAESWQKSARELAVSLIRRHYARLGGAEKLVWLMESPDREVRLFAVRLLWEKHRPSGPSASFKPKAQKDGSVPEIKRAALEDAEDPLRLFLRTTLLGLPPGRMERRDPGALADRALPASVAKTRLIEVVRDMAIEDEEFARLVTPTLVELTHSAAKGEWQSAVAALARISHAPAGAVQRSPATPAEGR